MSDLVLLADENVDGRLVAHLRQAGFAVAWVSELMPAATDPDVLAEARRRQAILITDDLDFGELIYRQRLVGTGIVLMRLAGLCLTDKCRLMTDLLIRHGVELQVSFTVVDAQRTRMRPLSS